MDAVHIMMDLETWGTRPGSAIRSVGAVEFGPGGLGREFYCNIEDQSCQEAGLAFDPATETWWAGQGEAAKAAFTTPEPLGLDYAVREFERWVPEGEVHCWAHGASFDPVLWEAACHAVGASLPFRFWDLRDTRTLYALSGVNVQSYRAKGTHHHALDDAKAQAEAAITAHQMLGVWHPMGETEHG